MPAEPGESRQRRSLLRGAHWRYRDIRSAVMQQRFDFLRRTLNPADANVLETFRERFNHRRQAIARPVWVVATDLKRRRHRW